MISCANKILSRSNNILSRRNKLKNKTHMSLPGFRMIPMVYSVFFSENIVSFLVHSFFLTLNEFIPKRISAR